MIPKIIFQTHEYRYEEMPEHCKMISLSWQKLNPDWHYTYHDKDQREEYVKKHAPELYPIYKKVHGAHKADIWRYLIVRNEGGVYADMDSFCIMPLNYMLRDLPDGTEVVTTKIEKDGGVNNSNFAAVKNSKILTECLKEISSTYVGGDTSMIHKTFSNNVMKNNSVVYHGMVAEHSRWFKKEFSLRPIMINYYGQEVSYLDFLSNEHML